MIFSLESARMMRLRQKDSYALETSIIAALVVAASIVRHIDMCVGCRECVDIAFGSEFYAAGVGERAGVESCAETKRQR
jgi:hypothetical protein